jgi:hypothetical protein
MSRDDGGAGTKSRYNPPAISTLDGGSAKMKRLAIRCGLLAFAASAIMAAAQTADKTISESVFIPVVVKKTWDSKHSKPGDKIEMEVMQDVKNSSGEILIPRHAKMIGAFTMVQPKDKQTKESKISAQFDMAEWKGGSIKLKGLIGGQVQTPQGSDQMMQGGMNPHAATPLDKQTLSDYDAKVERDDKYGTVMTVQKHEIELPPGSTMTLTTVPQ